MKAGFALRENFLGDGDWGGMHLLLAFNAGKLNPSRTLTPVYNVARLALTQLLGGSNIAQYLPYKVVYMPHCGAMDAHALASL